MTLLVMGIGRGGSRYGSMPRYGMSDNQLLKNACFLQYATVSFAVGWVMESVCICIYIYIYG